MKVLQTNHYDMMDVLKDIYVERERQLKLWGEQHHTDRTALLKEVREANEERLKRICNKATNEGIVTWEHIIDEELAEALNAWNDIDLRKELVQCAAVIVAWIEDIDSRKGTK